jgi:hypothetical protein
MELKLVQDPVKSFYNPQPGAFRTFTLSESWNYCRVTFHDHHQKHIETGEENAFFL